MNKTLITILTILACISVRAQWHVGDSLYALGDYNKAIVAYSAVPNSDIKIAKSYDAVGNISKALAFYEKGITTQNQPVLTQYEYGKLLLKADRFKKADSVFAKLSKEQPKNPEFLYQSGLAKEALNDSTAMVIFNNVTFLDKEHLNAQYKLAKHYTTKRNFTDAATHIAIGLKADPQSVRFINLNALVYFYSKDYHNAVAEYEKLIALNQSNEQLHTNLALSYANTNQFIKAISEYKTLIKKYNDENPTYYFNLGKMYQAERDTEQAIANIERAIALQDIPLDKQYLTLATIYRRAGDYKSTFLMVEKALLENPNDEMLRYQYAVAADNYYKDDMSTLALYQSYLDRFGEKGRFSNLVAQRISDIKTSNHFEKKQ